MIRFRRSSLDALSAKSFGERAKVVQFARRLDVMRVFDASHPPVARSSVPRDARTLMSELEQTAEIDQAVDGYVRTAPCKGTTAHVYIGLYACYRLPPDPLAVVVH
jgi:hypothetical protein